MEFEFDELAFRRLHIITMPISVLMAILVLVLHQQVGLNPLLFFVTFTLLLMYAGGKLKFLPEELKERRSEKVVIKDGKVFYSNEFRGYKFERSIKDVSKVVYRKYFGIPVVVVHFAQNEKFKFYWFKDAIKLHSALKGV